MQKLRYLGESFSAWTTIDACIGNDQKSVQLLDFGRF